jgi:hypothetical protein
MSFLLRIKIPEVIGEQILKVLTFSENISVQISDIKTQIFIESGHHPFGTPKIDGKNR